MRIWHNISIATAILSLSYDSFGEYSGNPVRRGDADADADAGAGAGAGAVMDSIRAIDFGTRFMPSQRFGTKLS